jgi:hypothetical protein
VARKASIFKNPELKPKRLQRAVTGASVCGLAITIYLWSSALMQQPAQDSTKGHFAEVSRVFNYPIEKVWPENRYQNCYGKKSSERN